MHVLDMLRACHENTVACDFTIFFYSYFLCVQLIIYVCFLLIILHFKYFLLYIYIYMYIYIYVYMYI